VSAEEHGEEHQPEHVRCLAADRIEDVRRHDGLDHFQQGRVRLFAADGAADALGRVLAVSLRELLADFRRDPLARLDGVGERETDDDADGGHDQRIDERLHADPAYAAQVAQSRDADYQ